MNRELLIHTICPHIKQWCDETDMPTVCDKCPATVKTSQGEGVQMCRLNAEAAANAVLTLRASAAPEEGGIPERETWWLIEREGCGLYTTSRSSLPGWSADPWRAARYTTALEANNARLMMQSLRDESIVTEHIFINKMPNALPSDSGKAVPVAWRDALTEAHAEIVLAMAFVGRDMGTDRIDATLRSLLDRFGKADRKARAALAALAPATEDGGREITAREVLDWLRNRPGISWQATINDIEKAVADIAIRALSPSVGTGTDDWSERLASRVNQLKDGGCKSISCDAVLGLIAFVRDGEGVGLPSADRAGEA